MFEFDRQRIDKLSCTICVLLFTLTRQCNGSQRVAPISKTADFKSYNASLSSDIKPPTKPPGLNKRILPQPFKYTPHRSSRGYFVGINPDKPTVKDVRALAASLSGIYTNTEQFNRISNINRVIRRRRRRRRSDTEVPERYRDLRKLRRRERRRLREKRLRRRRRKGKNRSRSRQSKKEERSHQKVKKVTSRHDQKQGVYFRERKAVRRSHRQQKDEPYPQPHWDGNTPELDLTSNKLHPRNPLHIRSEIYRILPPVNLSLPDTLETMYFQDFVGFSAKPFRAGFYSVALDKRPSSIKVRTHKLRQDDLTTLLPVPGRGGYKRHPVEGYIITQRQLEIAFGMKRTPRWRKLMWTGRSNEPEPDLQSILSNKLRSHGRCDMSWKRLSWRSFVGITGSECKGSLGDEQVQIGVSMTLIDTTLLFTEGWYRVKDGKPLADVRIPYIFEKQTPAEAAESRIAIRENSKTTRRHSKRAPKKPFTPKSAKRQKVDGRKQVSNDDNKRHIQKNAIFDNNIPPVPKIDAYRMKSDNDKDNFFRDISPSYQALRGRKAEKSHNINRDIQLDHAQSSRESKRSKVRPANQNADQSNTQQLAAKQALPPSINRVLAQTQYLRDFRLAAAALIDGHEVGFNVKLSECVGPSQDNLDRLTFGGRVKDFVFVRAGRGKSTRIDYIFFSSRKTVMDSQGVEYITRQVTLYRGRRVKVKVIKQFSEPTEVTQEYMFTCKLYNEHSGNGGVKLFVDPRSDITEIGTFSSVAAALNQGRDLRLVAELARCKGKQIDPAIVVGTYVTDYDLVNGGEAIEISIPVKDPSGNVHQGWLVDKVVGHILHNGDVMLVHVSGEMRRDMRSGSGEMEVSDTVAVEDRKSSLPLSPAYHCKMSGKDTLKAHYVEDVGQSIRLFYST